MSKAKRYANNRTKPAAAQTLRAQWSGPLPPPSVLEGFDKVVPNGAERIFRMAEREQEHRLAYEQAELQYSRNDFRYGQVIGGMLALICVVASVLSVHLAAHPSVSIALVGIPMTALIGKILKR